MDERYVSVSIETWGDGPGSLDDDALGELGAILQENGAVGAVASIGGLAGGPGAMFGLYLNEESDAELFREVASRVIELFVAGCEKVGLPVNGIANIDIATERYLKLDLEREPERFAGLHEVAGFLGVSKQRVAELREREDFPAPLAQLAAGPVWAISSLKRFRAGWPRQPGRPRKRPAAKAV